MHFTHSSVTATLVDQRGQLVGNEESSRNDSTETADNHAVDIVANQSMSSETPETSTLPCHPFSFSLPFSQFRQRSSIRNSGLCRCGDITLRDEGWSERKKNWLWRKHVRSFCTYMDARAHVLFQTNHMSANTPFAQGRCCWREKCAKEMRKYHRNPSNLWWPRSCQTRAVMTNHSKFKTISQRQNGLTAMVCGYGNNVGTIVLYQIISNHGDIIWIQSIEKHKNNKRNPMCLLRTNYRFIGIDLISITSLYRADARTSRQRKSRQRFGIIIYKHLKRTCKILHVYIYRYIFIFVKIYIPIFILLS